MSGIAQKAVVLAIVSSSHVLAWNNYATVWPTEEHTRMTNAASIANVSGQLHTLAWSQTSSADYIPPLPYVFATDGFDYLWQLNAISATPTNSRAWTNQFYYPLKVDATAAEMATWDAVPQWEALPLEYVQPALSYTDTVAVGSVTVETVIAYSFTSATVTADMDVLELQALESYEAITERQGVIDATTNTAARPVFYRLDRDNCASVKTWIHDNCASFYRSGVLAETNFSDWSTITAYQYTWTQLCADASIPTNWHDYTPAKYLTGALNGDGHTVTQTWYVVGGGGAETTNAVTLANGDAYDLIGTNGEQIITVATNADILDGYYAADYGFRHVTNVLSYLTITGGDFGGWQNTAGKLAGTSDTPLADYWRNCTDGDPAPCTTLELQASAAPAGTTPGSSVGIYWNEDACPGGYYYYIGFWLSVEGDLSHTNTSAQWATDRDVYWYVYAHRPRPDLASSTWQAIDGLVESNYVRFAASGTNDLLTADTIGDVADPPCVDPAEYDYAPVGCEITDIKVLIDWQNGLTHK